MDNPSITFIARKPAEGADIDNVCVSEDGKTITFDMAGGTQRRIEQPRSIPVFSNPDPNVHCLMALSAALLAQQERIEALERRITCMESGGRF
ncbi:hypothetical protein QZL91_15965 [Burkholderia multivorans]|nr:hypothetical protein [Burkholderia multivorans]